MAHLLRLQDRYGGSNNQGTPPTGPAVIRRALPAPAAPEPSQHNPWRGPGGGGDDAAEGGRGGGDAGGDYAPDELDALFDAVAGEQQ